jgi:UDP-N-acetylglucosamine acyltransferase
MKAGKTTIRGNKIMNIHPTAIIEDGAVIGKNVKIGAYCIIGENVKIGDGTELKSHVVVDGRMTIGKNNIVYPFAVLGTAPQDLKYNGEASEVIIGDNNKIREYVTINPGTTNGGMVTKIGNNCLLMVGAHVAHDCKIGNHCILANNATLAGHVTGGNHSIIGGLSAIHQFVRIGKHAMIGGMSGVEHDVIPYGIVKGERASLAGINLIGMKRRNFSACEINNMRHFFKKLFLAEDGSFAEKLVNIKDEFKDSKVIQEVIEFLNIEGSRSICQVHGHK